MSNQEKIILDFCESYDAARVEKSFEVGDVVRFVDSSKPFAEVIEAEEFHGNLRLIVNLLDCNSDPNTPHIEVVYSCDIQETLFNIRNTQCLKRALVQNAIDEVEESYDKLNEAYNNIIDAFDVTDDSTTDYYRSLRDKLAIELYLKGTKLGNAINQANNVVKLLKEKAL